LEPLELPPRKLKKAQKIKGTTPVSFGTNCFPGMGLKELKLRLTLPRRKERKKAPYFIL